MVLTGVGFVDQTALILYVYLPGSWNGEDSCLTVSTLLRNVLANLEANGERLVLYQLLCCIGHFDITTSVNEKGRCAQFSLVYSHGRRFIVMNN